MALGVSESD